MQERFLEISTEKVQPRIAYQLRRLAKQIGIPTASGSEILLTRAELAEMTGTTLFTVSRVLCEWEERGLVAAGRQSIVLFPHFGSRELFENACAVGA